MSWLRLAGFLTCFIASVVGDTDPRLRFPQELRVHNAQKVNNIKIPTSKSIPVQVPEDFKVAVILSGHIRSFAFCEKSWQRYMLHKGIAKHLFFFAHALATKKCRMSSIGIDILQHLCTEFFVTYTNLPIISMDEIKSRLPSRFSQSDEFSKRYHDEVLHGNYFDMHRRRYEAYKMAEKYSKTMKFEWDLVAYVRFDLAFYSPSLDFYGWYLALKGFSATSSRGILAPPSCNFHGVCDRFAVGLPAEMQLYFAENLPYSVLEWSLTGSQKNSSTNHSDELNISYDIQTGRPSVLSFVKVHQRSPRGNSEHMLECWFIMNNITQVWVDSSPVTFTTLRSMHASTYCSMDRENYIEMYKATDPTLLEVDTCTADADVSPYKDFDLIASKMQRCGELAGAINSSAMCLKTACACGRWG